jgi:anti-anti-sigma factor
MSIERKESPLEIAFILTDELVNKSITLLTEEFIRFTKNDKRDAVIDLTNVKKLNSVAIAALIRFKNMLADDGRKMHLINTNETVLRVLELSGMERFLLD